MTVPIDQAMKKALSDAIKNEDLQAIRKIVSAQPAILLNKNSAGGNVFNEAHSQTKLLSFDCLVELAQRPDIITALTQQKPSDVVFPRGRPIYYFLSHLRLVAAQKILKSLHTHGYDVNYHHPMEEPFSICLIRSYVDDQIHRPDALHGVSFSHVLHALDCGLNLHQRDNQGEMPGKVTLQHITHPWGMDIMGGFATNYTRAQAIVNVLKPLIDHGFDCRPVFQADTAQLSADKREVAEGVKQELEAHIHLFCDDRQAASVSTRANILCASGQLPAYLYQCAKTGDVKEFKEITAALPTEWREEYHHQINAAEAAFPRYAVQGNDSAFTTWAAGR